MARACITYTYTPHTYARICTYHIGYSKQERVKKFDFDIIFIAMLDRKDRARHSSNIDAPIELLPISIHRLQR